MTLLGESVGGALPPQQVDVPGVQREVAAPGGMGRYALRRILTGLGTLLFVIVFNFVLFRLLPGDPIGMMTRGKDVDEQQLAELRRQFNAPLPEQFWAYIRNPFSSNLVSLQSGESVWSVVGDAFWPTMLLLGVSTIASATIGIWLGIHSAWGRGGRFDHVTTGSTLTLYSMPEFWLGMLLLIFMSTGVGPFPGLFPSGGISSPGDDLGLVGGWLDTLWHLFLPALTLTLVYLAEYSLVMRSSLIDEMDQDYLRTARAKGLRDKQVRRLHAVPNALLPTITLVFLNVGFVVSGAITVETVFSWPGLGYLTYTAIQGPDNQLLQALFLLFAFAVIVANVIADLIVATVDPRVRA